MTRRLRSYAANAADEGSTRFRPEAHLLRTWTDRTGAFKVEACYLGTTEGKIHLLKANGLNISVPLEKASFPDLAYIELMANFVTQGSAKQVTVAQSRDPSIELNHVDSALALQDKPQEESEQTLELTPSTIPQGKPKPEVNPLPPVQQVFFGRIIHSNSLRSLIIHPAAALGVTSNGTIAFLDPSVSSASEACKKHPSFSKAQRTTLEPLQFLFPGLIDTHMHAPQYPNLALGMEGDLKEWCEKYTDPMEASYADPDKARRVYGEMVARELANGTTTVAYNSSIHAEATDVLAETCLRLGQRAIVGKLCIDMNSTHGNWERSAAESVRDEEACARYVREIDPEGEWVSPCVQPRAGSYASPELMAGLARVAKRRDAEGSRIRVQAHMCETPGEVEGMHEVHKGFQSYADMYDFYGLMGERTILAHCIHLSERDIEVMKRCEVGVAHNANSNTCLTDGECRVRELLDKGIKVGLGSDCSAGYSISILNAMRQASNVSRHLVMHTGDPSWKLAFEELVFLGTLGGAQVCALDDKVGNFQPGKKFDALVVDVGLDDNINVNGFEHDDLALLKKWVFMGDDRSIRKVYVNGRLVACKDKGNRYSH